MVEPITVQYVRGVLPKRPEDAHKGVFGKLLMIVGSAYYPGAACLASMAALRAGVGIVTVATAKTVAHGCIGRVLEPTWLPLPETEEGVISREALPLLREKLSSYQAVCLGCGLTAEPEAEALVVGLLSAPEIAGKPLVLDADGINCAAKHIDILAKSPARVIVTPHRMEMARLCGCSLGEVSPKKALELCERVGATVVLKSEATLIVRQDGRLFRLEDARNPGLAKGGSGDVLAGLMASLCAQGVAPDDAACAAVWLHSQAGFAVLRAGSAVSMLPGDLLAALPGVFASL